MNNDYRVQLLSAVIDNVDFAQVCDVVDDHVATGIPGYMMSLNLDIMIKADQSEDVSRALNGADLILMDSAPLIKVARRRGIEVKEKLSGSDLMPRICAYAAEKGYTCAIMGGMPGVPEEAARRLIERYPGLRFVGTYSPDYGFEKNPDTLKAALEIVSSFNADILFVCLGDPKSALLIDAHLSELGAEFVFDVGAAVDFAAGNVERAPKWMQDHSLEWLYRFGKEPKRLFKRYFVDSWHFLSICIREGGNDENRN